MGLQKWIFFPTVLVLNFFSISISSQELYLGSGGVVGIVAGDVLYVNNNLSVDASASLTVKSDASSSASLLVSGIVTGNITYKRYISDTNWHLVSPPVSNQSISTFVADGDNSVTTNGGNGNFAVAYYKNTNDSGFRWTYHNASPSAQNQETLTNFLNGHGYSTNRTSAGDFTFTGEMASSDVNVNLTNSSTTHYWQAVGNPYPSFLPANNAAAGTNVFGQNISALDPSFAGLYLWNGSAYEVINHSSVSLHLSPGQAFIVRAKDESETFTFTKSLQSHQSGVQNFYRSANSTANIIVNLSNGTQDKSTEVKYLYNATTGLDVGYDAGTYHDDTPSFSLDTHLVSDSQGINFMLQCLPDNNYETMIIPLSVRAAANTTLEFSATANGLPQGTNVYLEDREHNTFEKINGGSYQITIDNTLQGIGRFYLHTSQTALSTEDVLPLETVNIYKTNSHTVRVTGLQAQETATIRIYDILGKQVLSQVFIAQNIQDILLPHSLKTGVYIVKLMSVQGNHSKKLIIE